jgi:hypothetical protein
VTKLYISGPMTGYPDHNFAAFNKAAFMLTTYGFEVENPADKGLVPGWTWAEYMKYDIEKLVRCDGVATLPGWQESKGACLEIYTAQAVDIPCRPVDLWVSDFVNPLADMGFGTVL